MGHTNETANYNLPQFIGTDKPTWLGDFNGAMSAIDAAIANAASAATDAASVATNAATVAAGAVTTANAASETATAASTAASGATTTANNAAETANNAQSTAVLAKGTADDAATAAAAATSAIGDLTNLDTTDKSSVVAAINEIVAELPAGESVSVTADGVKTMASLLNELFALVDADKINAKSKLEIHYVNGDSQFFEMFAIQNEAASLSFCGIYIGANSTQSLQTFYVHTSNSALTIFNGTTYSSHGADVVTSGQKIRIIY